MAKLAKIVMALATAATGFCASTFSLTTDLHILGAGATARLSTKAKTGANAPQVTWTVAPSIPGAQISEPDGRPTVSFTAPLPGPQAVKQCVQIVVTATAASGEGHSVAITLAPNSAEFPALCPGGSIVMSVLGLEQASAVSVASAQDLFFDFFQSHPLPLERSTSGPKADLYGPPWRWWGDVRIGSYPQQISAPVSQLASTFVQQVGALPVNKLARSGEFRTGLERRIAAFENHYVRAPGAPYERTSLGAFFYFGAQAVLNSQASGGSSQAISPGPRAYQQYGAGFRLTTRFIAPSGRQLEAPAMLAASFGQNELITSGMRRGVVADFEGFYPLPLGIKRVQFGTLFLFGGAALRLGRRASATDPSAAVIAMPNTRDRYSIGVGIDAVGVLKALLSPR